MSSKRPRTRAAETPPPADLAALTQRLAWSAVATAFGSLGRVCVGLDSAFRVRHASGLLDELVGAGAAERLEGRPATELFGAELFGEAGTLRAALVAGERREGWRASVRVEPAGSRLVSLTAAPVRHDVDVAGACDPDTAYIVVLRRAEEASDDGQTLTAFGGMVARSAAMQRVMRLVANLEQSEATILITGESGTGKEVLARAIHEHSPRRNGPFVAVACAALPSELLESELFGHVRGAFTGAVRDRAGRFELAANGTLFLDEIGDVPLALQVKLLRVLQERTFERVGESTSRTTHARIVTATHRDLRRAIAAGTFREDLYYRLRVVPMELPPLRARPDDIEPIARHLLARVGARNGRELRFSPDALRLLLGHDWPGNVRELENVLEYAFAVCRGQTILPEDLPELATRSDRHPHALDAHEQGAPPASHAPPAVTEAPAEPLPRVPAAATTRAEATPDDDKARISAALAQHHWSREKAARALGVSRTTLWRRMRELGLERG